MSYWKKNKLQRNHDQESFTDAYGFLLKLLEKEGYAVENGQTLREFSKKVDRLTGNADMSELTSYYERLFTGKRTWKVSERESTSYGRVLFVICLLNKSDLHNSFGFWL